MSLRQKLQQRDSWLGLELGTYVVVVALVMVAYFPSKFR